VLPGRGSIDFFPLAYAELLGKKSNADRRKLIAKQGYTDEELPATETIATRLNSLGYFPKKVAKDIRGILFVVTMTMKARQVIFHQLFYRVLRHSHYLLI
jgi:hypothetical protein